MPNVLGPATCFERPQTCVCENRDQGVQGLQPFSIVTSFLLVVIGVVIVSRATKFARYYGFVVCAAGLSAMYLHYKRNFLGQVQDFTTVYFAIIAGEVYFQSIRKKLNPTLISVFVITLIGIMNATSAVARLYLPYCLIVLFVMQLLRRRAFGLLKIAVPLLLVAGLLWKLDPVFCEPQSFLQLHAIWHILGGLLLFVSYNYFEKELASLEKVKYNTEMSQ